MGNDIYKSILPSEYQQVEYIENSGTQYINLGLTPSLNMKIYVRFMPTISGATTQYILGSRRNDIQISFVKSQSANYYSVGIARGTSVSLTDLPFVKDHIYNMTAEANETAGTMAVIGTDETEGITQTGQKTLGSYTESVNICLFAFNSRNIHPGMRCYACKIWDNGVLVRDMIPCYRKSDNVAGMYDLANDTFRTTSTGSFTAGNNVLSAIKQISKAILPNTYQQVDYIESNGTQYIDTGVIPTTNTGVDITYSYNSISSNNPAGITGIYQGTAPRTDTLFVTTSSGKTNSALILISRGSVLNTNQVPVANTKYNSKINWLNNNKLIYNNGELVGDNGTNDIISHSIIMFGRESGGQYAYSSARIYNAKYSEGNTIIRNFIPCYRKSDGVIGMYDLVTNTFYTNDGTGTFSIGNDTLNEITKIYKGNTLVYNKGN